MPKDVRDHFQGYVDREEIPNLLLASNSPGTGKTTVARALLNDLGYDVLFINASSNRGVGLVQNDLPAFCSSVSFNSKPKAVILDESDSLTLDAQKALRGLIEEYSKNVRFILTCNYPQKLITPIRSRLQEYEFSYNKAQKTECLGAMIKRCAMILKAEKVQIESVNALKALVLKTFPDNRQCISTLQKYAQLNGKIDDGILSDINAASDVTDMFEALKTKNFATIRGLIPNYAGDCASFLHALYKEAFSELDPSSIPVFIQIVGDANNNVTSCVDTEILLAYTLVQIMLECNFK